MLALFQTRSHLTYPTSIPMEFKNIKDRYIREVQNIKDYYHTRTYAINNKHILVRLSNAILGSLEVDNTSYLRAVNGRSQYVANAYKLTSSVSRGKIYRGEFYGPRYHEVLLFDSESHTPNDILSGPVIPNIHHSRHWSNQSPITVLWHENSDMGLLLPNGKDTTTGIGSSVLSIDLNLLSVMYREFIKRHYKNKEGSGLNAQHFTYMYVIPNILNSHIDITIMNRLMNLYYNQPMTQSMVKHPIVVGDYTNRLDAILKKVLTNIQDTPMRYEAMLRNIPTVSSRDMQDALKLPSVAPTQQISWALYLSRLKIIQFMLDIGGDKGRAANNDLINDLKFALKQLKKNNDLYAVLPLPMYIELMERVDNIIES